MVTPAPTAPEESELHPYAARKAWQLEALDRLAAIGMKLVDQIDRVSSGQASETDAAVLEGQDVVLAFTRVSRAIRQIIVLSQETMGMRAPRGSRGLSQGGAGRSGPYAGRRNPRDPWDYRDDYDDDEFQERRRQESEIEQRIMDELQRIHDRQVANGEIDDDDEDETFDPEETAEIEQQIFGVPDAGTPPSGQGPPWR